ncbi:hypothetical protein HC723_16630 [Vibrio sp. S11_S32]|uniref:hypothetical protein n=1 Tax=Vibrio sp. S11_S32 TaxID=2720225 RepID=UPI001680F915|nr:hypothetical protein [Vibrio sp. S11_S32]MBD1578014.1 hypothetical protein [Vibrio sp. S11_S32]
MGRLHINHQTLFVVSFSEKEKGSGFSSIVYKTDNVSLFLSGNSLNDSHYTLVRLLVDIVSLGVVESDYVDAQGGKMATFIHRQGANNNWVRNGISKLIPLDS